MSTDDFSDYAFVIEGSVVFGFGGERCTSFAFQSLGIDVCSIVPTLFSADINYEHFIRKHLSAQDICDIYKSLKANDLHKRFTIVQTGYIEFEEQIIKVGEIVRDIKECNPKCLFVCDPVIGDNCGNYDVLEKDLTDVYMKQLLPYADITTPNQFEVESLSGMKVNSQDDALVALQRIHDIGPNIVVMTSCKVDPKDNSTQMVFGSQWKDGKREVYRIDFKYLDFYVVGAGDLFAGCFVGYLRQCDDLKTALEKTVSFMSHICQNTYDYATRRAGPGNTPTPEQFEMRVVQCAAFLRNPTITHTSTRLM